MHPKSEQTDDPEDEMKPISGLVSKPNAPKKNPRVRMSDAEKQAQDLIASTYPGLPARMAAVALLSDMAAGGAEDRLSGEVMHPKLVPLEPRDRALARSITTAATRHLGTLRKVLGKLMERGLPKGAGALEWILVVGAAQILYMDVPDHAAVDLAVRGVRLDLKTAAFAAVVNGVLRNLIRQKTELVADCTPLETDTPNWLSIRWRKNYGEATAQAIAKAHSFEPTLDLTVKSDAEGWARRLGGIVTATGSVRLKDHTAIPDLEGYEAGEWWVQDAAAAIAAKLLRGGPGMRIADLCAAPGGKTAQLAATGANVTAVDRSAERLKRLSANMERLGLQVESLVADAANFKAAPFDAILVDAPCMATGTIRRHPDVAWSKRSGDIATLVPLQLRLLDQAAQLLVPNGRLVYCTCSLEPEEGEMQIAALLRRNPDLRRDPIQAIEVGSLSECINELGEWRSLPFHMSASEPRLSGLDGFFAARLLRKL